jgi:[ribosomal protein S18]-alanine N-acetyltransferase
MAAVLSPRVELRSMTRADLSAVYDIEQSSYPYPWSRNIFSDCLRVGYRCHVLTEDEVVRGYGIVSHALDECHLLNLCIHPERRGVGLAGVMVDHLLREARLVSASRMFLEVRPSNRAAIALYKRYGFQVIGRRPGYYPAHDGREDAMIMVYRFGNGRGE